MAGRAAKRIRSARKVKVAFVGALYHLTGELVDLSTSGVLVKTEEKIELETIGKLGIEVGPETFRCVAAVRRHVAEVGLAFKFLNISPHDRELLKRLLMQIGKPG